MMNLIDNGLYKTVDILLRILGSLPVEVRNCCALGLGELGFRLARRHRRIAIGNLTTAFGEEKPRHEIRQLARQAFVSLARMIFEIGWSQRLHESQFSRYFTLVGIEHYHKARAEAESKGKGVLMLGAHFSNWELYPIVAHMAKLPLQIVYRPLDAPFMDRYIKNMRTRLGAGTIPTRSTAMRKMYRALRRGDAVGLLMDQGADFDNGVFVDFFNRRAATNTGMAVLALKTGSPVLPFFLTRTTDGFMAEFGPQLPLIKTGDPVKDVEANTQQYNEIIEAYVRKHPDQWFWVHNRWKNLPFCPWPRTNPKVSNRY